ncbi:unnamed protein product [Amoebophrya sp. A25]|nr:unnamed protein product [Amoebophrya sp. A25]|eukprot:GSA25T00011706001.1
MKDFRRGGSRRSVAANIVQQKDAARLFMSRVNNVNEFSQFATMMDASSTAIVCEEERARSCTLVLKEEDIVCRRAARTSIGTRSSTDVHMRQQIKNRRSSTSPTMVVFGRKEQGCGEDRVQLVDENRSNNLLQEQ